MEATLGKAWFQALPIGLDLVLPATVHRRGRRALALVLAVLLAAGCGRGGDVATTPATSAPADPAVVQTASGAVRGVVAPDHRLFAGIPYAAPPIGPLRWQPPAPAPAWQGVREATHPGPRCIQDPGVDMELGRQTDEDCLTLNVWTPLTNDGHRPVMVWIHGGGFASGNSGLYVANGLASRGNIIVVTMNYRLGALGFLAHPALGPAGAVGNYGLADQQVALRWVRDNIAKFGGDPDKVTVAGESSGGTSVCDHLVAPDSAGLFRAAIIQSGPCQAQVALPAAEKISLEYADEVGCGQPESAAQCLRALPADKLREPVWYYRIGRDQLSGPVKGTTVLPVDPITGLSEKRAARVPVLIGSNHDEFTLFVALQYLRGQGYTAAQYPDLLKDTFGPNAGAVEAHYPLNSYASVPLAYSAAVTDAVFACEADRMADALSGTEPVYAYEFNDRDAPAPDALRQLPFPVGASHSLELRYLFDIGDAPPLNPAQRALADQMVDYWTAFVTSGSPQAPGQPNWPTFDAATGKVLSLQPDGSRVVTTFEQEHQCAFWASVNG
ncbi:MAG: para-nitrobenzyl esterase [Mycobacterium sp.]|nr:para-nitrobenzyl esterase [Mycobacterium sp.]